MLILEDPSACEGKGGESWGGMREGYYGICQGYSGEDEGGVLQYMSGL